MGTVAVDVAALVVVAYPSAVAAADQAGLIGLLLLLLFLLYLFVLLPWIRLVLL